MVFIMVFIMQNALKKTHVYKCFKVIVIVLIKQEVTDFLLKMCLQIFKRILGI